ncbi:MAG: hypothetical protein HY825_16680 [Acidobacteria bacterium]|nr:hypothetical protein [Acidobacteriota bacterium]
MPDAPIEDTDADGGEFRETTGRDDGEGGADVGADGDHSDAPDGSATLPPVCGDRVVDPGEECDDGNRLNGDSCDWQCRLGPGSFDYPPLDPSLPALEPAAPAVATTDPMELDWNSFDLWPGPICRGIWFRAGGGGFALAYNYSRPYYGVRVRILDHDGVPVAPAWSHETEWDEWAEALGWDGAGFALFSSSPWYGVVRSRFDTSGAALEEMIDIRGPDPCTLDWTHGGCWGMTDAAWNAGRWLVAGSRATSDVYSWAWRFETYDAAGSVLAARDVGVATLNDDCVQVAAVPAGFLAADSTALVVLDPDLEVLSWSGMVRAEAGPGAMALTADGVWTAWAAYVRSPDYYAGARVVAFAAYDLDGSPRFPARVVYGPYYQPSTDTGTTPGGGPPLPQIAIAHGPAGNVIVFWEGDGVEGSDGRVRVLSVDDWGNVRSPPQAVLPGDVTTPLGWVIAAEADADGYAVVAAMAGDVPGTADLYFRRFRAVP